MIPTCKAVQSQTSYKLDLYENTLKGEYKSLNHALALECPKTLFRALYKGDNVDKHFATSPKNNFNKMVTRCQNGTIGLLTYDDKGDKKIPEEDHCSKGQAICGFLVNPSPDSGHYIKGHLPMEGLVVIPICCNIPFNICPPNFKVDRYESPCNAENTETTCKIVTKTGLVVTRHKTKEEEENTEFGATMGINLFESISPSLNFKHAKRYKWAEINTEAKEDTKEETQILTRKVGEKILLLQPVIDCGPFILRSESFIPFITPSTSCDAKDELVLIEEKLLPVQTEVTISFQGIGTRWKTSPDHTLSDEISWAEISEGVPKKFQNNGDLLPSKATGFNWFNQTFEEDTRKTHPTWERFSPRLVFSKTFTVRANIPTSFYKIRGMCEPNWVTYPNEIVMREGV